MQCPYYAVVIYSQMMPYITVNDKGNIILYTTPDGASQSVRHLVSMNEEEIDTLNRIVNLYIDYAELRAKDHKPMYMHDWIQKLDDFLRLSDKEILSHAGSISAKLAKEKADAEYDKFKERTVNELTPVEIHFIENFEREQKRLKDSNKNTGQ